MRRRHKAAPEELVENRRWLAEARAVLAGGTRPPLDGGGVKMLSFLFNGECDAHVSEEGFFVRYS